jgi:hypothetical protein
MMLPIWLGGRTDTGGSWVNSFLPFWRALRSCFASSPANGCCFSSLADGSSRCRQKLHEVGVSLQSNDCRPGKLALTLSSWRWSLWCSGFLSGSACTLCLTDFNRRPSRVRRYECSALRICNAKASSRMGLCIPRRSHLYRAKFILQLSVNRRKIIFTESGNAAESVRKGKVT